MGYEDRRIALAGPYPIAFDTPGLVNPDGQGIILDEFEDGALILAVYADVSQSFDANAVARFEWGDPSDWDSTATSFHNDVRLAVSGSENIDGQLMSGTVADGAVSNLNVRTIDRHMTLLHAPYNSFGLWVSADGDTTQGAADVYVVLAHPVG